MDFVTLLGFAAAILTTLAFVPQLIQIMKTKSTKDISLLTFSGFTVGVFLWLVYGILTNALPVIAANIVTLILAILILFYKIKYK
ncbi:MAG: SemiSWEET transporter [Candidatus Diapherotrites archaeon]|nr:SemiSWEET transporter [Candidatus Diapherotrites archaeon]